MERRGTERTGTKEMAEEDALKNGEVGRRGLLEAAAAVAGDRTGHRQERHQNQRADHQEHYGHFLPLPAEFDDSESKNGANFLVCVLRQIERARRKGVARKGQVSSAGNTLAGYERIRRIEPSPVWTVSAPPPPLILPRTSDLLMMPSTVTGNPRLMRPSLVWASRSA